MKSRIFNRTALAVCLVVAMAPAHGLLLLDKGLEGPKQAPIEATRQYNAGIAYLNDNDLAAAQAAFEAAFELAPRAAEPLLGLAQVALLRKDASAVETWLGRALNVAPGHADVRLALGRWRYAQGRSDEAVRYLNEACAMAPDNARARIALGEVLLNGLNRPAEAAKAFRAALAIEPGHAGAHYALGIALSRGGHMSEAIAELERAAALASKDNARPLVALARLYVVTGRLQAALASYDRLIAMYPDLPDAHIGRGDALAAQGHPGDALVEYERALQLAADPAPALVKIGMIHQQAGRIEEAEQSYLKAIAADPRQLAALNNLAWMAAERRERLDDALAWARQAVALAPREPAIIHTLAWVQRARGEQDHAIDTLRQGAAGDPPSASLYFELGTLLEEANRHGEALAALERALAVDPAFGKAAAARARIEALRGAGTKSE